MSSNPPPPPPVALNQARERVIRQISEHFAQDNLDEAQLEDRLDRAIAATSLQELDALVADLPVLREETASALQTASAGEVRDQQTLVAIMGGTSRKGVWVPPRRLNVIAVMGGAELDFREARFGAGTVEVTVFAMMGGVEITVPPDVRVEVDGIAVMGGFDARAATPPPGDQPAPVLRIGGFVLMGGVEVRTRLRGESKQDARERARLERKEARRRLHRGE